MKFLSRILERLFAGFLPLGAYSPIRSGTYQPVLSNGANVAASTTDWCNYIQVGRTVFVSGNIAVDPTLALTVTLLGISLPIATDLTAANQLNGVINQYASAGGSVSADTGNDRAQAAMYPADVSNAVWYFSFSYTL